MIHYQLCYYALDPTHMGSGAFRVGRVDLPVARDPSTNLPVIHGSAQNAVRAGALYSLGDEARKQAARYARAMLDGNYPRDLHRGGEDAIAKVFGYAESDEEEESIRPESRKGESRIGMVNFRDALLTAIPVATALGPRWVTCPFALAEAGCGAVDGPSSEDRVVLPNGSTTVNGRINLGWLVLQADHGNIPFVDLGANSALATRIAFVKRNLVVVHDNLFPFVVNRNLDVRTSNAIDFERGVAADGALFTYEATPRGCVFVGGVEIDDKRQPGLRDEAETLLKNGLGVACEWGLGGMTTRGFGRMAFDLKRKGA